MMIGGVLCLFLVTAGVVDVYKFNEFPGGGEPSEGTHKARFAGRSCHPSPQVKCEGVGGVEESRPREARSFKQF